MWFGIAIANGLLVVAIQRLIVSAPWDKIAEDQNKIKSRKNLIAGLLSEPTGRAMDNNGIADPRANIEAQLRNRA